MSNYYFSRLIDLNPFISRDQNLFKDHSIFPWIIILLILITFLLTYLKCDEKIDVGPSRDIKDKKPFFHAALQQ